MNKPPIQVRSKKYFVETQAFFVFPSYMSHSTPPSSLIDMRGMLVLKKTTSPPSMSIPSPHRGMVRYNGPRNSNRFHAIQCSTTDGTSRRCHSAIWIRHCGSGQCHMQAECVTVTVDSVIMQAECVTVAVESVTNAPWIRTYLSVEENKMLAIAVRVQITLHHSQWMSERALAETNIHSSLLIPSGCQRGR